MKSNVLLTLYQTNRPEKSALLFFVLKMQKPTTLTQRLIKTFFNAFFAFVHFISVEN